MQEIVELGTRLPWTWAARSESERAPMDGSTSVPDEELFAAFLRGDETAFVELFGRHNQRLYNYCAKMLGDREVAGDITQSVWERLIRTASGEVADATPIGSPIGFLYRVARNLCFDYVKHDRLSVRIEEMEEDEHPHTSERVASRDEELVVAALDTLSAETKEILVLHYYSGYSFDEIADIIGKKPNAIWTRVSRARTKLKEEVERARKAEDRYENRP